MMIVTAKKITSIQDLKLDPKNARKHNERNVTMIADALREIGAARSGVIDEEGRVLAGNATLEALKQAGIDRIKVVETDGSEWIVVKRTGLSEEQKVRLALYDNRTSELGDWDLSILSDFKDSNLLDGLFMTHELDDLLAQNANKASNDQKLKLLEYQYKIIVDCESEKQQLMLLERFEREGYKCRALIL